MHRSRKEIALRRRRPAQRRPIEKNDLPEAFKVLKDWKDETAMRAGQKEAIVTEKDLFLRVARKRLLESPDINVG